MEHETDLRFSPYLAEDIGLNEAIIFAYVSTREDDEFHGGVGWLRCSMADWEGVFPFWSAGTIRRTIRKMEDAGMLVSIQPWKSKGDATKYYRTDYDAVISMISKSQ